MRRFLISTILLTTLLFNGHDARAQSQSRKTIDNFNQVTEDTFGNTTECPDPMMPDVLIPCYVDLLVDDTTTMAMSYETGLLPENVIGSTQGSSRKMTLGYEGTITGIETALMTLDSTGPGTLQISNGTTVFSTATVIWDGESMGLSNFDMGYENQLARYDNFVLGVFEVDINTDVTIKVTSKAGPVASLTTTIDRNITGPEELLFSLKDRNWENRDVFQTSIQSIALIFSKNNTYDVIVDYFELQQIIPEPSLVWGTVIALGTGMISTYKKRKLL